MGNSFEELLHELRDLKAIVLNDVKTSAINSTYLKVDKAAEFLSTTKNALTVMVHKRQIPYIKRLGKLYFLQSDLVEWLEEGRVTSKDVNAEDILVTNKKRS